MVALHWICGSEKGCNGFVRRRVESIWGLVPVESWLHIDSKLNPAVIISRGAFMSQLSGNATYGFMALISYVHILIAQSLV